MGGNLRVTLYEQVLLTQFCSLNSLHITIKVGPVILVWKARLSFEASKRLCIGRRRSGSSQLPRLQNELLKDEECS